MTKVYWDLRFFRWFWYIYFGWPRLTMFSLGLFLNINLFLSNLWHWGLNESNTMASPLVSSILTSVLKFVYLILFFMQILSAHIHKSLHFKQLGGKSRCCPRRSWESCILEMHWNSSYLKAVEIQMQTAQVLLYKTQHGAKHPMCSNVLKILIMIYDIKGCNLCFPGDRKERNLIVKQAPSPNKCALFEVGKISKKVLGGQSQESDSFMETLGLEVWAQVLPFLRSCLKLWDPTDKGSRR